MQAVGLIVEYNPFHNGHQWHLQQAKKMSGCSCAVGVMSGNFVQRGEPAIFDKWKRAEMAIAGGVDLIIELPVPYAVRSAEYFARGAVRLLHSLHTVSHLCFGAEEPQEPILRKIAEAMDDAAIQGRIKHELKTGHTYARALSELLNKEINLPLTTLSSPNNILAIEYLRAIKKFAPNLIPLVIKRQHSSYHDIKINTPFASATAIREAIATNNFSAIEQCVPPTTFALLRKFLQENLGPVTFSNFTTALLAKLRMANLETLAHLPNISEGLHYKLSQAALISSTIDELLANLKSKRYTFSRLQRLLLYALLDIKGDALSRYNEWGPLYARVLGFNDTGRNLLKQMRKTADIPIVIKTTEYLNSASRLKQNLSPLQQTLALDTLATDIYCLGIPNANRNAGGWDFKLPPVYLQD